MNYLPGLASNCDPPDLCLLSSWDCRCEPPVPSSFLSFNAAIDCGVHITIRGQRPLW
jgi:hypothetical protein